MGRKPKTAEVPDLKPCPFCGEFPRLHESTNDRTGLRMYMLYCPSNGEKCLKPNTGLGSYNRVIEKWNRRAEDV